MAMKLHELHPSLIHAPLTILPGAAVVDLVAAIRCDRAMSRLGSRLWVLGAGAGLVAGLAGMAASQEVSTKDSQVSDAMYLHGIGNLGLVMTAAAMACYRSSRPAGIASAVAALIASGSALYTAYLGGELVYGSGLGVKAMSERARSGVSPDVPRVFSAGAPARFFRDAAKGLGWLLRRTYQLLNGEAPFDRRALHLGRGNGVAGRLPPPRRAAQSQGAPLVP